MKLIFADFETYYDKEYSLRKMTPVEYILDPRFEAIGCSFKHGLDGKAYWVPGEDLAKFFASLDGPEIGMVSHNALFDMCVAAWRFGFVPKLIVDTMGISRAALGHLLRSVSLASVMQHLGIGVKGTTVHNVVGMGAAAIKAAGLYDDYAAYSVNDCEGCAGIFDKLVRGGQFPVNELAVMDMVLRCAIQPQFRADGNLLAEHLSAVQNHKDLLLTQAMLTANLSGKHELMSNDKFAEVIRGLGVEPPMKASLTTGLPTYAFAKSDTAFINLEDHENPAVQAVVAARLGHKSTLEEKRSERLLKISQLTWPVTSASNLGEEDTGFLPVPLRYGGAHTGRLSGDWKLNLQNLPSRKNNTLRRALIPRRPGEKVVTVDASQIEARIVAWICGQTDLVEQFACGADIYSDFASEVFGHPVNRKLDDQDHKTKGFVGKTGVLGLGFGVGWPKFQWTVKALSKDQLGRMIELSDEEAVNVVTTYRRRYPKIPAGGKFLNTAGLNALAGGGDVTFGPCTITTGSIILPNGLRLHYPGLRKHSSGDWWFDYAGKPEKIYGGKLLENIVQAIARILTMDAAVRIQKRLASAGIQLALQCHDELVYCVPDRLIPLVSQILQLEMKRCPSWAPDIPLASEVGVGASYGDAK